MQPPLPKRKTVRLKAYDYSQVGSYFITICTIDKSNLLGKIVGDAVPCIPAIELTHIGKTVQSYLEKMNTAIDYAHLDNYVIMPNHVHLLITIDYGETAGTQRTTSPTGMSKAVIPRIVHGLKAVTRKYTGRSVWQRSYHDHVIRNENSYQRIWQYIDENPLKWQDDCYFNSAELM